MFNGNSEFPGIPKPTKKNLHFHKTSRISTSTLKYEKCYPCSSASLSSSFYFFCFPKPQYGNQSSGLLVTVPSLYNMGGLRKSTVNFVLVSILILTTMSQDSRISDLGLRPICSFGFHKILVGPKFLLYKGD